jgi:hypothetical protein
VNFILNADVRDFFGSVSQERLVRWRRSQKDGFTWARMPSLGDGWLPAPRILHPWPDQRFPVTHPR